MNAELEQSSGDSDRLRRYHRMTGTVVLGATYVFVLWTVAFLNSY